MRNKTKITIALLAAAVIAVIILAAATAGKKTQQAAGDPVSANTSVQAEDQTSAEIQAPADDPAAGTVNTGNALPASFPTDKYRTTYEVFVRSFADGMNNDGIGDIRGLIQKLDYINDGDPASDTSLGCSQIWQIGRASCRERV